MQGLQCQKCCYSSWLVSFSLDIGGFVEKEILCRSTVSKIGGLVRNRWVAAVPWALTYLVGFGWLVIATGWTSCRTRHSYQLDEL